MTITEHAIETERGRAAWLEAGAGWPVILLHAFPLTAEMWRPQLASVPDGWRFIAPHLRGFGGTLPPSRADGGAAAIDDYAADVGSLMDALEIESAMIGGLSMGGYVAFALFRQEPARFAGMVLADTRSRADTPDGRAARTAMRTLVGERGASAVADQMLPKLLSERARREQPDVVALVRGLIERQTPEGIDAAIAAMMDRPDATADLAQINCGTLVLVGEHDAITPPAEAEAMQQALSRATLAVIPDAGHLSNLEQPEAFSRALADFLLARL
jgi:3-oxoadipate enol-lactonase